MPAASQKIVEIKASTLYLKRNKGHLANCLQKNKNHQFLRKDEKKPLVFVL